VRLSGKAPGLAALAAAVTGGATAITLTADAATETLLSQGKPAAASSVETSALGPANAFDGRASSRWGSAEGVDPQWIQVDLGVTSTVTHVNLSWETAYGRSYQIQVSSDGADWRSVYSTTNGDGATDDLTGLTGTGRFARLSGLTRGTRYGYSLYEFKVYGTSGESTPTAGASRSPTRTTSPGPTASPTPSRTTSPSLSPTPTRTMSGVDLFDPHKKDIAMQLVSSAENSSLDWRAQYKYIEDIGDGRGDTAGIIGFCSGSGDLLELVQLYTSRVPNNVLARYLPALRSVNGSDSHAGLDPTFTADWRTAAKDAAFQQAQNDERDRVYFNPSVNQAKADGLHTLGQFSYYDAIVMHGPGNDSVSFGGIRRTAMAKARTPAQGGNEVTYLNAFLDARKAAMLTEEAHSDTSRVDTGQRVFLDNRNLNLDPPLSWKVYGDPYYIAR
jgi:chitosanase